MKEELDPNKKTILVIDDEKPIIDILVYNLKKEGYNTLEATDGEMGLDMAVKLRPNLILLDVMLPKIDGLTVCKRVKQTYNVPVVMLSAKDEEIDKIVGLELGADDYVTKPYDIMEIKARVKALLRRIEGKNDPCGKEISYDGLTVSLAHYEIIINGVTYKAPPREIELLYELASNPNRVYTRDELLDILWGVDYFGDGRTVDVHIKRLRKKINGASDKWRLTTVWGVGYKFEVKND